MFHYTDRKLINVSNSGLPLLQFKLFSPTSGFQSQLMSIQPVTITVTSRAVKEIKEWGREENENIHVHYLSLYFLASLFLIRLVGLLFSLPLLGIITL